MMTSVTVSPLSWAIRMAVCQTSSETLMVRFGVAGWFGTREP